MVKMYSSLFIARAEPTEVALSPTRKPFRNFTLAQSNEHFSSMVLGKKPLLCKGGEVFFFIKIFGVEIHKESLNSK